MIQPIYFIRSRWDELLITCIYLNGVVASIFTWNAKIMATVILGGLALLALIFYLRSLYNRKRLPIQGDNKAFKAPRKGLIFTVGFQSDTIRMALQQQNPKFVAFICSKSTANVADELAVEFGYDEEHYVNKEVDPRNVDEIRIETNLVLDWLLKNMKPEEIAVDITGGMTTMSLGVFSISEERKIDSQYIFSRYQNNKCITGTQDAIL
jgi:hypothetical protein